MKAKLVKLAERRVILVAKAAVQRAELAQRLEPWRGSLAVVDQGVAAIRYIKSHPEIWAAMVVFAVVVRPRRISSWLRRGWVLWRLARAARRQ